MRTLLSLLLALPLFAADGLLESRFTKSAPSLDPNPALSAWRKAPLVVAAQDRFGKPLPEARTEIRSLWTSTDLYFLFTAKYESMYLRPTPQLDRETVGLWDFDVVEVFIGHELERTNLYKEFEVSPRGEWVDLDIDKSKPNIASWEWNSNFTFKTQIDEKNKTWHCLMKIPWASIAPQPPVASQEFRLNLYRIEGGPDPRKYITWQAVQSPSFHTPAAFGRLRLKK
ncbi:MAG: carbohydrate-binding family 9-like protein [Bryobacteraceae bacterium]|nr:carbohydrate-binding family 9-like protein [Bryobacteraceae bacterium]